MNEIDKLRAAEEYQSMRTAHAEKKKNAAEEEYQKMVSARVQATDNERNRLLNQRLVNGSGTIALAASAADVAALASAMAGITQEVEAMAKHMGRIDELVRSLLDTKAPFTDDDIAAIKAHVRHPGALEAAKLRETVRCLQVACKIGAYDTARSILEGLDAKG